MAKEAISSRIEPELKEGIKRAAEVEDRKPGEIARKVLELGWPLYLKQLTPEKRKQVAA